KAVVVSLLHERERSTHGVTDTDHWHAAVAGFDGCRHCRVCGAHLGQPNGVAVGWSRAVASTQVVDGNNGTSSVRKVLSEAVAGMTGDVEVPVVLAVGTTGNREQDGARRMSPGRVEQPCRDRCITGERHRGSDVEHDRLAFDRHRCMAGHGTERTTLSILFN